FPDAQIEIRDGVLVGTTGNLGRLRERIRTQRIRDTARRQLLSGRQGDRSIVRLSKQAASVGVVNFASGGPLGDIVVEIESDDLDSGSEGRRRTKGSEPRTASAAAGPGCASEGGTGPTALRGDARRRSRTKRGIPPRRSRGLGTAG